MPYSDSEVTAKGIPDVDVMTPPPSMARSASDWATSFIRGLAKGTVGMAGLPGDVSDIVGKGVLAAGRAVGLPEPSEATKQARGTLLPSTETLEKALPKAAQKYLQEKPSTTGGKYAQSIGEFAPAVVGGEGGLARKALQAVTGGVGGEAGGEAAQAIAPGHETAARVLGAITGQGVPGMVRRAVTPLPISAERQALVNTLRHEGVEPTAGDVSGSRALKYAEHALGNAPGAGGAYHEAREAIDSQYARAALRRIGENADRATPEVMERAGNRIGQEFDNLAARNAAHLDPQFGNDIFQAQHDYDHLFVDPLRRPIVERVIENATNLMARSNVIPGEVYQAQRSLLERMRRGYRNDPELNGFLANVRDALDGVMERSIRRNNPDDLGAWRDARNQYRNLLTLERVTSGGGEAAAEGVVSPARLRQASVAQGGRRAYARGQGDFGELARAGNAILTQPPSSGTSERAFLHAIPAAIGATGGALMEGAPGSAAGAILGTAAPGLTGRALMSAPMQAYLRNQLLAQFPGLTPSMLDRIVRSALAEHGRTATEQPPMPNAKKAPDGKWYVPDPNRPGKYLRIDQ